MSKYMPTYKWWAATVVAVGTVVQMMWTGDGINTDPERVTLIALVVQRLVAYITSNRKPEAPVVVDPAGGYQ